MTLLCWSRSSCFNDLFVLFPFMCKCISICKCVYMNSRAHGGKMHKVPWTWLHIWLWAAWQTLWEQISDRWERSKYSQLLSHPYNSLELRVNKVLLKNYIFIMVFSEAYTCLMFHLGMFWPNKWWQSMWICSFLMFWTWCNFKSEKNL